MAIIVDRETKLVVQGLTSQQIAARLGGSVKTVDMHRGRIRAKMEAPSLGGVVHDVLRHDVVL